MKLIFTCLVSLFLVAVGPAVAAADDTCGNSSLIILTLARMDAGLAIPPAAEGLASSLRDHPEGAEAMLKFLRLGREFGYSPQLTSYVFEAHCRGLDLNKDFSVCDPVPSMSADASQSDWSAAMARTRQCVLSLAGGEQ